jgi:chitodextrinase
VTTTSIAWNWGTNTDINFNAATDVLDFGWFAADQFTISEVNGTVVIAIPSNHQTYTLQHTTLSDLHLSNIVAKDASAISEWTTVLGSAPVAPAPPEPPVAPPITPPVVPPDSSAAAWSANTVYTAGMTATENGVTYKANWWTQGADPAHNNGVFGTGQPWTIVATADASHDVPTVPTGLAAAGTSGNATTLTWNAASVPGNGVVTGYAIFEDGHQVASVAGTTYTAANLAADTIYTFAVAALDAKPDLGAYDAGAAAPRRAAGQRRGRLVGEHHLHRGHDRDGKRRHLQSRLVDAGQRSRSQQRRRRHRPTLDDRRRGRCVA